MKLDMRIIAGFVNIGTVIAILEVGAWVERTNMLLANRKKSKNINYWWIRNVDDWIRFRFRLKETVSQVWEMRQPVDYGKMNN